MDTVEIVSIPQLGWGGFRLDQIRSFRPSVKSFNPSVGMGWFQTPLRAWVLAQKFAFQSLSWDGVVSDRQIAGDWLTHLEVSIPQLGWGGFRLPPRLRRPPLTLVSIPQLGWGGFRLWIGKVAGSTSIGVSIPQLGWGGFRRRPASPSSSVPIRFNPSVGFRPPRLEPPTVARAVSIPQLGWGGFRPRNNSAS